MGKPFLQRKIVRLAALLLVLFLVMQLYRPALDNPPVTADLQAPPEVKAILKKACYDCHSNETRLLWFDEPVPAYWLVAADVKEGRSLLNFSHWDSLTADQRKGKLFECLNQIVYKEMAPGKYSIVHRDAILSPGDIAVLRDYLATQSSVKIADGFQINRAEEQFRQWEGADGRIAGIRPELNGLAFMPEYRDWQAVGSTERWDNGTMRLILGNPVAVRAIREGRTNPWPDGTAFAKIAWEALADTAGNVVPGEFRQVELMVKDKDKYAATEGWGWGRWKGMQLKPYGRDAYFTTECTHCHQPMHDYDFVFTSPVNWRASGGGGMDPAAFDPLDWKVIGSKIDRRNKTMSTVYGNDIALAAARKGWKGDFPAGAKIAEAVWSQKEDEHWYGGNIPNALLSVRRDSAGMPSIKRPSVMP